MHYFSSARMRTLEKQWLCSTCRNSGYAA